MNILIVEDDLFLSERIAKTFRTRVASNRVRTAHSFEEFANELPIIGSYDIVLTDLRFPGDRGEFSGYRVIRAIREQQTNMPIVVISGSSDIEELRLAFDCGASDYIIKPIRLRELELRVLNWFKNYYFSNIVAQGKIHQYRGLTYDIDKNEFSWNDLSIPLTKNNKYLLSLFFANPERLLPEMFLVEKIWGDLCPTEDRNLRVNILRLKQALLPFGIDTWIRNIRGEGYLLSAK